MKLELQIIDGPHKGKSFSLKNGLHVGQSLNSLNWEDSEMAQTHGVFVLDQKKRWHFECLDNNKVRVGSSENSKILLLLGLVFHIGQTGFKVTERAPTAFKDWTDGVKGWLEQNQGRSLSSNLFFFHNPIQLSFTQGIQFQQFHTLSYGPREIGYNSLDLNIPDPSLPGRIIAFLQENNQPLVKNLCGDLVRLNGRAFDKEIVTTGDQISFGSHVIELSLTK